MLRFGVVSITLRACANLKGFPASPNQRLFSLFLPGAELTLYAQVHGEHTAERQMLFEALEQLGPDDVLVLDRGYSQESLPDLPSLSLWLQEIGKNRAAGNN